MRELGARLGARPLGRTTRSVTTTEAGARLLEALAPALAEIVAGAAGLAEADEPIAGSPRITNFAHAGRSVQFREACRLRLDDLHP